MRQRQPGEANRREQSDVDGLLPGGIVEVVESPGRRAAGIRDEDVDGPERVQRRLQQPVAALCCADIRDRPGDLAAGLLLNALSRALDRCLVTAAHHDARAFARELFRDRACEPFARRRDDRDFSLEPEVHGDIVPRAMR